MFYTHAVTDVTDKYEVWVPTAPDWPVWVRLMLTTHFDLVLGPFWVPGGPKRAHFGPNVKCPKFPWPHFCGIFLVFEI